MLLPDFRRADVDLTVAASHLSSAGSILLRQALTLDPIWLQRFQKAYLKMDHMYYTGQMQPAIYEQFYRYGHVLCDLIENYSLWLDSVLTSPLIQNLFYTLFGPQAYLLLNNSSPRRQGGDYLEHAIPFHQDCEFVGNLKQAVNLWIPLSPAGGKYPGLELCVNGPQHPVFALHQSQDLRQSIEKQISPERLWRPEMQPGDILIFSPYTIHRTYLPEACTETRFSSEIRLISIQDAAYIKSPVIVCEFGKGL